MLRKITKTVTCNASGVASVTIGTNIRGLLHALYYRPTTMDTGADLTVTVTGTGAPILTKINLGTGNSWLYPRAKPSIANDATGGLNSTPSALIPIVDDTVTFAVVQGGNGGIANVDLIWDDGRIS